MLAGHVYPQPASDLPVVAGRKDLHANGDVNALTYLNGSLWKLGT